MTIMPSNKWLLKNTTHSRSWAHFNKRFSTDEKLLILWQLLDYYTWCKDFVYREPSATCHVANDWENHKSTENTRETINEWYHDSISGNNIKITLTISKRRSTHKINYHNLRQVCNALPYAIISPTDVSGFFDIIFRTGDYSYDQIHFHHMMTSSNGNIFRVTALCVGNSPVTGEFSSQRSLTRSLDIFLDLRLDTRLGKQSRRG